jgi:hypothetical protein
MKNVYEFLLKPLKGMGQAWIYYKKIKYVQSNFDESILRKIYLPAVYFS